jgi:hypothetical protein
MIKILKGFREPRMSPRRAAIETSKFWSALYALTDHSKKMAAKLMRKEVSRGVLKR